MIQIVYLMIILKFLHIDFLFLYIYIKKIERSLILFYIKFNQKLII